MIYEDGRKVISRQRAIRGSQNGRTDCVYVTSKSSDAIHINQVLVDQTVKSDDFVLPHFDKLTAENMANVRNNFESHMAFLTNAEAYAALKERTTDYIEAALRDQEVIVKYLKGNLVIDAGAFKGFKNVNLQTSGNYSVKICSGAFDEDAAVKISTPEGMERMIVSHTNQAGTEAYMLIGQKELVGIKPITSAADQWEVKSANVNEAGVFTR